MIMTKKTELNVCCFTLNFYSVDMMKLPKSAILYELLTYRNGIGLEHIASSVLIF